MSKKPKVVICRNCNTPIAKDVKICPSCGAKNRKPFYKQWWFILLIIVIAIGVIGSIGRNKKERFDWKEIELCDRLPKPKSNVGHVFSNSEDELDIQVKKISDKDYKKYVSECQNLGYTVESEKDETEYKAFGEDSYALSLSHIGETMYIELVAPEEMATLNWPKSEIASLLPLPDSTVGKTSSNSSGGCFIYVGETSIDDFNIYADKCAESGFAVDYERGDKFYHANDGNGNQLSLTYQGNNVMSIQIKKPDEVKEDETKSEPESETPNEKAPEAEPTEAEPTETEPTETEPTETENPGDNAELVDGMRPEFRTAMDSYEEFMNEYCDFMKKYGESDGTDLGLLKDYADYMSKYADAVKGFETWNSEEMNTAEAGYYLEVQTRINKRLLEAAE